MALSKSDPSYFDTSPIIIATSVGFALATVFLLLRLYVRIAISKHFGFDDWALIGAYISFVPFTALQLAIGVIAEGDGMVVSSHEVDLIFGWHNLVYGFDQSLIKIALAALYFRILPQGSWQKVAVAVSTAIFVSYTLISTFVYIFSCGDPAKTSCLPHNGTYKVNLVQSIFNASMDWLLTLLPLTLIWQTQMPTRTKLSVVAVMMVGVGASIISVIRIFSLTGAGHGQMTRVILLSYGENCISQIAISSVALRPLFRSGSSDTGYDSRYAQEASRQTRMTRTTASILDVNCTTIKTVMGVEAVLERIEPVEGERHDIPYKGQEDAC